MDTNTVLMLGGLMFALRLLSRFFFVANSVYRMRKCIWLIAFYLLFLWLNNFIGIDMTYSLMGTACISYISWKFYKASKLHTAFTILFYLSISYQLISSYLV